MKSIFYVLLTASFLCFGYSSYAQRPDKLFSAGFGLEGGVPVGNLSNVYNACGGMTARFALHAGPGFATITVGGILYVPKNIDDDNVQVSVQIPIKAGYKFIFARHLFVMGEAGYSTFKSYTEDENNDVISQQSGGFTYAPSAGVQFGVLELGVRYETMVLKSGNQSFVGFRLGFNF